MKYIYRIILTILGIVIVLFSVGLFCKYLYKRNLVPRQTQLYDFSFFDNEAGHNSPIVPNIVHYVIFGNVTINFITFLSIVSVIKVQQPNEIWIHCDTFEIIGQYWELLEQLSYLKSVRLEIKHLPKPIHVWGQTLSSIYHSTDIGRIQVLMKFGGIYLDTDTLVLKPLDKYLNYEMVVGWPENDNVGTQILIGHKDARFLRFWLNGYRRYRPRDWYYNAGVYPAEFLSRNPGLVHRVKHLFGVQNLLNELYSEPRWHGWKELYAVHLLARHPPVPSLDPFTISRYNKTFGAIGRWLLYETTPILNLTVPFSWTFNV